MFGKIERTSISRTLLSTESTRFVAKMNWLTQKTEEKQHVAVWSVWSVFIITVTAEKELKKAYLNWIQAGNTVVVPIL